MDKDIRRFYEEGFEPTALDPGAWFEIGHRLKYAADVLLREFFPLAGPDDVATALKQARLGTVYLMLAGMAVESVLKGLIVRARNQPGSQASVLRSKGRGTWLAKEFTHDLPDLYRLVGLRFHPRIDELLNRLTVAVTIAGRYPVGRNKGETGKLALRDYFGEADPDAIRRLWERLQRAIKAV